MSYIKAAVLPPLISAQIVLESYVVLSVVGVKQRVVQQQRDVTAGGCDGKSALVDATAKKKIPTLDRMSSRLKRSSRVTF